MRGYNIVRNSLINLTSSETGAIYHKIDIPSKKYHSNSQAIWDIIKPDLYAIKNANNLENYILKKASIKVFSESANKISQEPILTETTSVRLGLSDKFKYQGAKYYTFTNNNILKYPVYQQLNIVSQLVKSNKCQLNSRLTDDSILLLPGTIYGMFPVFHGSFIDLILEFQASPADSKLSNTFL